MSKSFYIAFILLVFFSSCDKVKKTQKKIKGEWEIVSYRTFNNAGLTEYHEANGKIKFGSDTDSTFTYCEDFVVDGVTIQRSGIGTFVNESGLDYKLDISLPTSSTMTDCSIKLITKDDLKIEQRDSQLTHIFVLKND